MAKLQFWTTLAIIILLTVLFAGAYLYLYQPVTTVILVRHAEKNIEPNNPDPALSQAGLARAEELVRVLGNASVTAIYATQYQRTQQTVQPLASRLGLRITQIDSSNLQELVRQIKSDHAGGVVFVAGHNNTVPAIIAKLNGGTYPTIPETQYDNMFVVTVYRFGRAKTLQLKYGSAESATASQQMMAR